MSQKTLAYPERETALVLAAVMSVSVYDAAISAGLLAEHITQPPLAAIWTAVATLRDSGKEVRFVLAMELLRAAKMEQPCKELLQRAPKVAIPDDSQAYEDAAAIVGAARAREAARELTAAVQTLQSGDDPREGLSVLRDKVFAVAVDQDRAREKRSTHKALKEVFAKIADKKARLRRIDGVPTFLHALDIQTQGWQYGKPVIVAARPGGGKTAFATSTLMSQIDQHDPEQHPMTPTLFFSLEMDDAELVKRLLTAGASISRDELFYGAEPPPDRLQRVVQVADRIDKAPLEIDDETPRTVEQIAAEIYRWHRRLTRKSKKKVPVYAQVIIDYLTRIKRSPGQGHTLPDRCAHSMSVLADVAKRTGAAIVVLSQLTRGHVKEGRAPEMDDLKGGGDIEENAFHVVILHPIGKREDAAAGRPWRGSVAALLEKNRHGSTQMVMLKFEGAMYHFRVWNKDVDGPYDDVLAPMDTGRPNTPKKKYTPSQKTLPLPPSRPAPGDD